MLAVFGTVAKPCPVPSHTTGQVRRSYYFPSLTQGISYNIPICSGWPEPSPFKQSRRKSLWGFCSLWFFYGRYLLKGSMRKDQHLHKAKDLSGCFWRTPWAQGVNLLPDLLVIRKAVVRKFLIWHSSAVPSLLCSLPSFSDYIQKQHPAARGQCLMLLCVYIVPGSSAGPFSTGQLHHGSLLAAASCLQEILGHHPGAPSLLTAASGCS